ncbi:MAG: helix-turn-helix domain-containing protein [Armatimonadota bacterium]
MAKRHDEDIAIRDQREPGWWWADNEIIDLFACGPAHLRLKPGAILLYLYFCRNANRFTQRCRKSIAEIAAELDMSQTTVVAHLKSLQEKNLIRKIVTLTPGTQERECNEYVLLKVKGTVSAAVSGQNLSATRTVPDTSEGPSNIEGPVAALPDCPPETEGHTPVGPPNSEGQVLQNLESGPPVSEGYYIDSGLEDKRENSGVVYTGTKYETGTQTPETATPPASNISLPETTELTRVKQVVEWFQQYFRRPLYGPGVPRMALVTFEEALTELETLLGQGKSPEPLLKYLHRRCYLDLGRQDSLRKPGEQLVQLSRLVSTFIGYAREDAQPAAPPPSSATPPSPWSAPGMSDEERLWREKHAALEHADSHRRALARLQDSAPALWSVALWYLQRYERPLFSDAVADHLLHAANELFGKLQHHAEHLGVPLPDLLDQHFWTPEPVRATLTTGLPLEKLHQLVRGLLRSP